MDWECLLLKSGKLYRWAGIASRSNFHSSSEIQPTPRTNHFPTIAEGFGETSYRR